MGAVYVEAGDKTTDQPWAWRDSVMPIERRGRAKERRGVIVPAPFDVYAWASQGNAPPKERGRGQ